MSQEQDDKLDALWRSASGDAGRPAAKTRAAILAEAAAAARRREPAANAPRYWMRMVAGVAVVGIGLVLWRQTDVRLPGERAVAEPMMQERTREAGGAGAASVADAELQQDQSVSPAEDPPPASAPAPAMRSSTQQGRGPTPAPAQEAPAPLREQADEGVRQEMKVAQERALPAATADRRAAAQGDFAALAAAPPSAANAPDGASLLREHFPAQDASSQTHRLWVVLDAAGNALLTGELEQGARLEDLAPRIRRETGREPTAWRIEHLANQQNRRIEMGIMQLAR